LPIGVDEVIITEEAKMKALKKDIPIEERSQRRPKRKIVTAEESVEWMKQVDEWRKKNLATFRKTKAIPR
jgi:hypothetical protein